MIVAAVQWNSKTADPAPLEYYGREVLLELELRAPKPRLNGATREEGEFSILPTTIHLIRVKDWAIQVPPGKVLEGPALFQLNLPKRPEKSTEWSEWISSTANEGLCFATGSGWFPGPGTRKARVTDE